MDWGVVVLLIVVIGAVTSTIQAAIAARARTPVRPGPDELASSQEIRALRERVAVLERIATDRNVGLEHEIERLRDR
jgi:hypothetical protein